MTTLTAPTCHHGLPKHDPYRNKHPKAVDRSLRGHGKELCCCCLATCTATQMYLDICLGCAVRQGIPQEMIEAWLAEVAPLPSV